MQNSNILDAARRAFRRIVPNRQTDPNHAAIRLASTPEPVREVSPAGLALIKRFEGCARQRADGLIEAYPDPATGGAPWTIGWGAIGGGIGPGTLWTQAQCDARLARDVARHAAEVSTVLRGAPTTPSQFDALVSFHYNTGAIARATLTRKHMAGDFAGARAEFRRWNRAGGRVIPGLTRRRAAEAALYGSDRRPPLYSGGTRTSPCPF